MYCMVISTVQFTVRAPNRVRLEDSFSSLCCDIVCVLVSVHYIVCVWVIVLLPIASFTVPHTAE